MVTLVSHSKPSPSVHVQTLHLGDSETSVKETFLPAAEDPASAETSVELAAEEVHAEDTDSTPPKGRGAS